MAAFNLFSVRCFFGFVAVFDKKCDNSSGKRSILGLFWQRKHGAITFQAIQPIALTHDFVRSKLTINIRVCQNNNRLTDSTELCSCSQQRNVLNARNGGWLAKSALFLPGYPDINTFCVFDYFRQMCTAFSLQKSPDVAKFTVFPSTYLPKKIIEQKTV